jgi:hypothetical protein
MPEPEIQPLVPLILSRCQINSPLLHTHRAPNLLPRLVPPDVIALGEEKKRQSQNTKPNQHAITPMVQRLVVLAVDIRAYDSAELNGHVVASGRNGARSNAAGVFGSQTDEDRVAVGVA